METLDRYPGLPALSSGLFPDLLLYALGNAVPCRRVWRDEYMYEVSDRAEYDKRDTPASILW